MSTQKVVRVNEQGEPMTIYMGNEMTVKAAQIAASVSLVMGLVFTSPIWVPVLWILYLILVN